MLTPATKRGGGAAVKQSSSIYHLFTINWGEGGVVVVVFFPSSLGLVDLQLC